MRCFVCFHFPCSYHNPIILILFLQETNSAPSPVTGGSVRCLLQDSLLLHFPVEINKYINHEESLKCRIYRHSPILLSLNASFSFHLFLSCTLHLCTVSDSLQLPRRLRGRGGERSLRADTTTCALATATLPAPRPITARTEELGVRDGGPRGAGRRLRLAMTPLINASSSSNEIANSSRAVIMAILNSTSNIRVTNANSPPVIIPMRWLTRTTRLRPYSTKRTVECEMMAPAAKVPLAPPMHTHLVGAVAEAAAR